MKNKVIFANRGIVLQSGQQEVVVPKGTAQINEAFQVAERCLGHGLIPCQPYEISSGPATRAIERLAAEAKPSIH